MKIKKSKKANLENKRGLFFQIGLILVLSIVLYAFEWGTPLERNYEIGSSQGGEITILPPVSIQNQEKPKVQKPRIIPLIKVIPFDTPSGDDIPFFDAEDPDLLNDPDFIWEEEEEEAEGDIVFKVVEEMPSFPGGDEAFFRFLRENIKYPKLAREAGIQGVVLINFIVTKTGSVESVHVERGIGGGCDEEAMRVFKIMPDWNPGKQRTIAVNVQQVLPVHFKLIN